MDIQEIKRRKGELEVAILSLIDKFQEETGAGVSSIQYSLLDVSTCISREFLPTLAITVEI